MDSAGRNFAALAGISTVFAAGAMCGFVAYVLIPLIGSHPLCIACLLPTIMLGGLLTVSVWLGGQAVHRQLSASHRLARRIDALALPLTPELRANAEAAGLGERVNLVNAEEGFSFVYGLLVPRVAISRGLVGRLSTLELRAALEHERYHVGNRDPLRALIGTVLAETLFLLPSLAVLHRRYEAGRELAADQRAERTCGPRPLIGALLKALEGPDWPDAAAGAPLGGSDLLSMRLSRIETGRIPRVSGGGLASFAWSIFGIGVVLTFFAAAIIGVGGISALDQAVGAELSPAGAVLDAQCVMPVLALAAIGYWSSGRLLDSRHPVGA